jgi:hypothetical protein
MLCFVQRFCGFTLCVVGAFGGTACARLIDTTKTPHEATHSDDAPPDAGDANDGDNVVDEGPDGDTDAGSDSVDAGPDAIVDAGGDTVIDAGAVAVCGNHVVEDGEVCDEDHEGCVDCHIPCGFEGGRACGQNGVPGDVDTLYECQGGERLPLEACPYGCLALPAGTPDRCAAAPGDDSAPQGLIDALDVTPYVEQDCEPTTVARWPYEALRCTYTAGPLTTTVTTATPSASRVAAWIVDAATLIPAVHALKDTAPARYEEALIVIANAVLGQSSRIFPLQGGVIENMGSGYENYPFRDGISDPCSSGCYCRINSLHRTEWCAYQASIGAQTENECLDAVGRSGHTDRWAAQCLGNHIASWNSNRNEHFRAKASLYQQQLAAGTACIRSGTCTPSQVVNALEGVVQ